MAHHHPSLASRRQAVATATVPEVLSVLSDEGTSWPERAAAAWRAFGLGWSGERVDGNLDALSRRFVSLGAPVDFAVASIEAARKSREAITLMACVAWLAANRVPNSLLQTSPSRTQFIGEVPMYALDKHTRIGRQAIRIFAATNVDVKSVLTAQVQPSRRNDAAYMAAFYTDAAPLAYRLVWDGADELEAMGRETDFLRSGVAPTGTLALLEAFRNNLDHLNALRAELFERQRSAGLHGDR